MSPQTETQAMHRRALAALNAFIKLEAAGGIVLLLATIVAMVVANSALAGDYQAWLNTHFRIGFGHLALDKSVSHWINDGLMVVFLATRGAADAVFECKDKTTGVVSMKDFAGYRSCATACQCSVYEHMCLERLDDFNFMLQLRSI